MSVNIQLSYNQKTVPLQFGKSTFLEELYVDFQIEKTAQYERWQIMLHPKEGVTVDRLVIEQPLSYQNSDRIFCNGFQSWSESREYPPDGQIPPLRSIARRHLQYYGDTYLRHIKRGKGHLHSWTYTYRRRGMQLDFFGSLNEHTAFTLFQHDTQTQMLRIEPELEQLQLEHSFPILDLCFIKGHEQQVFDQYFALLPISPPSAPKLSGWTSWYNYYTDISEEIILDNARAFAEREAPIDVIQIDDGYQTAVGDWLDIKPSFPNGMGTVANEIHQLGYKAGLWIAPFVCAQNSNIFKTKSAWLLKDSKGHPLRVGYTPLWKGWFYALNFYHPEVQEYLTGIFYRIFHKWGFDLAKLDFLYAACIAPPKNKTRGQVMHDVMTFLRQQAEDRWLLGCGVPLGSAFGQVDYCRIGADIHLRWEHQLLKWLRNRERVSTLLSLRSTLGRWQLNGRAFHNDPDVILLRSDNLHLSSQQQYTILLVNVLLGNLVFTSDHIRGYSAEQWAEFQQIFHWQSAEVSRVLPLHDDLYQIEFQHGGTRWLAAINLNGRAIQFPLGNHHLPLEAYESMVVRRP